MKIPDIGMGQYIYTSAGFEEEPSETADYISSNPDLFGKSSTDFLEDIDKDISQLNLDDINVDDIDLEDEQLFK